MAGFVRAWFRRWRGVGIDLRSPLPIETARARLRDGTVSRRNASGWGGGRRVIGRVRDDGTVRLEAATAMVRNSWRPIAQCVLEPDGTGCRLIGSLRAPLIVLAVSAFWLGMACLFFVAGLVATIVTLLTGHAHEAGAPAIVMGAGAGLIVFGSTLFGVALASGRRDGDFLLDWLREQLKITPEGRR